MTLTLFGDNGRIDHALSAELDRRGTRTHTVSVETGWLPSAENVICRLDTVAGQRALEGLAGRNRPAAHVLAMCQRPTSEYEARRLRDLCEECGRHHEVSLVWHSSVTDATQTQPPAAERLARLVVDEVSAMMGGAAASAFTSRYIDLG